MVLTVFGFIALRHNPRNSIDSLLEKQIESIDSMYLLKV